MPTYKTRILVADNDKVHLRIMRDFLKRKGYSVVVAHDVPGAQECLRHGAVDLALLDVRLTREGDRTDISGLTLAALAPKIPKIIVTKYPRYQTVRLALGSVGGDRPVAIDFIPKPRKLVAIQGAIEDAVANAIQRAQFGAFFDRLQNGNRDDWKRLWDKEAWRLITLVQRHGFSRTTAQTVCFEVFRDLAQAKRPPRGSTLKSTLVNETVRKIERLATQSIGKQGNRRRAALKKSAESPVRLEFREDIVAPVVNNEVSKEKLVRQLQDAIADLPVKEQKAIVMYLVEEILPVEIAKRLRVTTTTVNRYLRSASAHLGNRVEELN